MSRKNGISNYGYRDQNDFQSSVGLVCEAITNSSSSSDKDIINQLVESVNLIFNKAIVDAKYNNDNKEFEFNNYYDAEVDRFKFPYIVDTAEYDADTKKVVIKFEDETIEPIEIDLSAINVSSEIEAEISARTEADQAIWNAVGDLSGSTVTSGKTLLELIEEEVSARTENCNALANGLDEEINARAQGDEELSSKIDDEIAEREADVEEIWDAISSGSSIIDLINEEISARESADTELWVALNLLGESAVTLSDKLNEEISARTASDSQLADDLEVEKEARIQGDEDLSSRLMQEIDDRQVADLEIANDLSNEVEARTSGDTELNQKIADEKAARIYWINQVSSAVTTESSERQNADEELWNALSAESESWKANDNAISGAVDTEKVDRIAADEEINSKIEIRAAIDNVLSGAIETEREERMSADTLLSSIIDTERAERIAEDDYLANSILDNQVHVERLTDPALLDANIREEYLVKNSKNEVLGEHIKIYKDASLLSVELVHEGEYGQTGQFLKFTYLTTSGTRDIVFIDVSEFLSEAEFKDGFIVNRSGEVRILIDSASNPYLTVSEEGLRLSGVTEIETSLATEINRASSKEQIIEANLDTERATRELNDGNLDERITNEIAARENKDAELELTLSEEITRAKGAESAITAIIDDEITNRQDACQQLNALINVLDTRLTNETSNRESEDTLIRTDISNLRVNCTTLGQRIDTVNDRVDAESNRAQGEEEALQTALSTKANSVDVYYKTESDRIFATKSEIPSDFYSQDAVDEKDNAIKAMVTAETITRESEDAALNRIITGETQRATTVENALSGKIETINAELSGKLSDISSDLTINVDKTNAVVPKLNVNISSEANQIIKVNADGLYAKATLDYDEEHNILLFTTSNANPKSIELKTKSSIDNIYYNSTNETIVIEYTVNGSRKEDVVVPVGDLIDEWRVADGHQDAIELKKVRSVSGDDVLSAKLFVNTSHDDNIAMIDDNALYVSKNAIVSGLTAEIAALTARVEALENALNIATAEHTAQSQRITQVEQNDARQDDAIAQLQAYADEP